MYIYIYVCVCVCVCIYIYIYIFRPKGRSSDAQPATGVNTRSVSIYGYT